MPTVEILLECEEVHKSMSSQSSMFWNSGLPRQQKFQLSGTCIPFIFQPMELEFGTQIKYLGWSLHQTIFN